MKNMRKILMLLTVLVLAFSLLTIQVSAVSPVIGISVTAESATSGPTLSDGVITITRQGSLFSAGTTATITLTNSGESTANISFTYSHTGSGTFQINGETKTSGTYSGTLDVNGTVSMSLKGSSGYGTATLKLSVFSWTAVSADAAATVTFDSTKGAVTLGGTDMESGGSATATGGTLAAVATPASGCSFLGWVNSDTREMLSSSASVTLNVPQSMNIEAVFANNSKSTPYFGVGSGVNQSHTYALGSSMTYYTVPQIAYLFDNLPDAANFAEQSTSYKYIVLMNDGTLPAGEYTIPAGTNLLIPFNDANTFYSTEPLGVHDNGDAYTPSAPTAYRTLTMGKDASIEINGTISLSAQINAANSPWPAVGSPHGKVSFVKMEEGSKITVNDGGALYAWGYITGSGSVTAKSGATVYECFQFEDFRGGSQMSAMTDGVFPLSQYYIQNIEVPLTLEAGAKESCVSAVYMRPLITTHVVVVTLGFVDDSGSMFNITRGSLTKRYDGSTDRLVIDVDGDLNIAPVTLSVGDTDIDSTDYELPINSNITVNINEGSTVNVEQDLAILPGVVIDIKDNGTLKIAKGYNMYVYDADQWGAYCGTYGGKLYALTYAPGRTYKRTASDLVDAEILVNGILDASEGYLYTTSSGANIHSTGSGEARILPGSETVTYQNSKNSSTNTTIPITSAQLKNKNGSYVATGDIGNGTYTYKNDYWHFGDCDGSTTVSTVDASCTEKGSRTTECACRVISTTEEIAALGHDEINHAAQAPTCTEIGWDAYVTCSRCDYTTYAEKSALGHDEINHAAQAPTCTEIGWDAYVTCSRCDYTTYAEKSTLSHSYNSVVTAPTCTEAGYTTYTCTACGDSYTADEVPATGHTWEVTYEWQYLPETQTTYTLQRAAEIEKPVECTATAVCANDAEHTASETVYPNPETKLPTYEVAGTKTYTATFESEWAETQTEVVTTAVATVGGTAYTVLKDALEAAKESGESVVMQSSVDGDVPVSQTVTVVKGNYTVNVTAGSGYFETEEEGDIETDSSGTTGTTSTVQPRIVLSAIECNYDSEVVLEMIFLINDPALLADENAAITLTKAGRWGDVEKAYRMSELSKETVNDVTRYVASIGIASGEMTCPVDVVVTDSSGEVTVFDSSGTPATNGITYKVKYYIDAVQASSGKTEAQKAAAKALGVYGAYAQQYFLVRTDELAYAVAESDLSAYDSTAVSAYTNSQTGSVDGMTIKSFETHLDSNIFIRFRFTLADGADISKYTATLSGDGVKEGQTLTFVNESGNIWYLDTTGIPAAYMDSTYTVTISDGTNTWTLTTSVLSWVRSVVNANTDAERVNLAKALYLYNQACNTLFGK